VRHPTRRTRPANALGLSQLDVISCALGAAALLSVTFSAVKGSEPPPVRAEAFVDITFETGDPGALLGLVVRPPGVQTPIDLRLEAFDPLTGRLSQRTSASLSGFGDFILLGFSRSGERLLSPEGSESPSAFKLFIARPAPGQWRVDARYQNRTDLDVWFDYGEILSISRTVISRDQGRLTEAVAVAFGAVTNFTGSIVVR